MELYKVFYAGRVAPVRYSGCQRASETAVQIFWGRVGFSSERHLVLDSYLHQICREHSGTKPRRSGVGIGDDLGTHESNVGAGHAWSHGHCGC